MSREFKIKSRAGSRMSKRSRSSDRGDQINIFGMKNFAFDEKGFVKK